MSLQIYFVITLLGCSLSQGRLLNSDSLLPRPDTANQDSSPTNKKYLEINGVPPKVNFQVLNRDIACSLKFVNDNVNKMHRLEANLGWSDIEVHPGTPLHGQALVSYPEVEAMQKGRHGLLTSKATIQLMHKYCRGHNLSKTECAKYMSNIKITGPDFHNMCSDMNKECSEREIYSKYRSIDGSCNNRFDRTRGKALTSYKRLLFPDYTDGVQEPRRSVQRRHSLPSARDVSSKLIKHINDPDLERTMMVAQWTQFISHDMSHTVSSKMLHSDKNIKCCSTSGRKLSPRYMHPFCAPIDIAKDDKFYSQHGMKCMSYVRSVPAVRPSCRLGPLEQLNQATHFLDASNIYGSNIKKATQLRTMEGGLLRSSTDYGRTFLPLEDAEKSQLYFVSGDQRVNTLLGLTSMHTIWLREHNKIAEQLNKLNPQWSDETLYQEARRIVIAEIQHITYNEWLPTVLSKEYTSKIDSTEKFSTYFDQIEDPSISNSFATAAIRFSKSLLEDTLKLYFEDRSLNSSIRTEDYFNKPNLIENYGNLDSIIRGLATQNSQRADLNYGTDITSQLYSNGKYGYDIVSLDIQRGRDHGLPSYTAFRSLCGLPEVQSFNDFAREIPKDIITTLSKVYRDPHDVDLLIGGLAETPKGDSLLGPTFSCIVADQFLRTKFGDRYFYDHAEQPKPFSGKQLADIKRVTLARILCDNADNLRMIQPDAFKPISTSNPLTSCNDGTIPHLNLNHWMES